MAKVKKTRRDLMERLDRARIRYDKVQTKLEAARAKTEKRTKKLHALEETIFTLEHRLRNDEAARLGQAAGNDKTLRPARLIVNTTSGGVDDDADKIKQIVERLRAHGLVAELGLKTSGKAARELAKEAVENKEDLVIVAGGDGTIEEVALELIGSKTQLGIVPVGSSNNLARALGIPLEVEDAITLIGMGTTRGIDIGQVTVEATGETKRFMETAGVGLLAVLVPGGQAVRNHHWSELSGFFKKLLETGPDPVSIELDDGQVIEAKSQVVTVSNSPLAALNFLIAPDAKMDDGLLDVTVYDDMGRADILAYFMAASHGEPAQHPKVRCYQSKRALLRSAEPVAANADKDAIEPARSFKFESIPGAVSVIAGRGVALTVPVESVPSVPPLAGPQKTEEAVAPNGNNHDNSRKSKRRNKDDWRNGKKREKGAKPA